MKKKIKMTARIRDQIERYIAIAETIQTLEKVVKAVDKASKPLTYLPTRASRSTGITGSRRRILYELDTVKKEIKALEERRYRILSCNARLAIIYSVKQQIAEYLPRFSEREAPELTNVALMQLGTNNISQALKIPLGTVLNDQDKKAC